MREKKQINIEIGEQVRQAREQARLTQEQLAERIDVSPQFVSDLERGVVGISIPTLKRLCCVLGVSSDQILFASSECGTASAFAEKCRVLSPSQQILLLEMADRFILAVEQERSRS